MKEKTKQESKKDGKGARAVETAQRVGYKAAELANKVRGKVSGKVNVKTAGVALGSVASFVTKPCVQFYDGVREGFNKKAPPARD